MQLRHVIEAQQFNHELLNEIFSITDYFSDILEKGKKIPQLLAGKIMCTLFYEPSTRTRMSFESAMKRLEGKVISTEAAGMFSSAIKGESLEDTIRIIDDYCDVIVLRHSDDNSSEIASKVSKVPIVNAGSGKGQHPTQTLLDLYTIKKEIGKIDGTKIAMIGDLAYGRTVRSLIYLLGKYDNIEVFFVSPENLKIKEDIKDYLERHKVKYSEENDLHVVLPIVDVVYMTRIQKERMNEEDYLKSKGKFVITEKELELMKPEARLLHPLPHVEEINLSLEIEENDRKIAYFRQARNGLFVRMALLKMILASEEPLV